MLKGSKKGKFRAVVFKMTAKAILLIEELKRYFSTALILVYFNSQQQLILKTESSKKVLGEILSQLIEETGQ